MNRLVRARIRVVFALPNDFLDSASGGRGPRELSFQQSSVSEPYTVFEQIYVLHPWWEQGYTSSLSKTFGSTFEDYVCAEVSSEFCG